jgi:hypothetical protein
MNKEVYIVIRRSRDYSRVYSVHASRESALRVIPEYVEESIKWLEPKNRSVHYAIEEEKYFVEEYPVKP